MLLYGGFGQKKNLAKKGDKKYYSLYSWDRYYFFKFTKCISKAAGGGEMFTTIFFAKFPLLLLLLTDPVLHFSDSYIWIMTVQSYKPLEKSALKVFYIWWWCIFPQENKLDLAVVNAVIKRELIKKEKYFQTTHIFAFLVNFFEFWRPLIDCLTQLDQPIRRPYNIQKSFAKEAKVWFAEFFFQNTSPL